MSSNGKTYGTLKPFWGRMVMSLKLQKRHQIRSFAIQERVWLYQSVIGKKKTSVFENLK